MADEKDQPQLREHLRAMRRALGGIGKDVEIEVADTPRTVKEGTKNTFARAAGVRRAPMREWTPPASGARDDRSSSP
jgi:hypothetical protein